MDQRGDDEKIWRYLTLAKFLYMLEGQTLPFVRLDMMIDQFEGAPPPEALGDARQEPAQPAGRRESLVRQAEATYHANQQSYYASCWHRNETESGAMWAQYSREGVAIQSTRGRLMAALDGDEHDIHIGAVTYEDGDAEGVDVADRLSHVFRKRTYYEYEREFRAVICADRPEAGPAFSDRLAGRTAGEPSILIPVAIGDLIQNIYVTPGRPDWYHQLVADLLRRYSLDILPTPSWLDEAPRYH